MAFTTVNDPSKYFQTALYTGNQNANVAVVNGGNSDLQPDWVWGKNRDGDSNHWIFDSSRGVTKLIQTDVANVEEDQSGVTAFNTDGFTLGDWIGSTKTNDAYVSWQWKCNGGTTTNVSSGTDNGNATTACVRQVNNAAGFGMYTYTADDNGEQFIEHGLSSKPTVVIVKNRGQADSWCVGHSGNSGTTPWYNFLNLDVTDVSAANSNRWLNTEPSSTVINLGASHEVGADGENYVCYAFFPIQGYSKFGSYEGNGNANGTFTYTGFKPAWLMVRNIDSANVWQIYDNLREPANPNIKRINAEVSSAESTSGSDRLDFLSNGFKMRATSGNVNSAHTYVYMAFAESPFVSSTGTPTTAR